MQDLKRQKVRTVWFEMLRDLSAHLIMSMGIYVLYLLQWLSSRTSGIKQFWFHVHSTRQKSKIYATVHAQTQRLVKFLRLPKENYHKKDSKLRRRQVWCRISKGRPFSFRRPIWWSGSVCKSVIQSDSYRYSNSVTFYECVQWKMCMWHLLCLPRISGIGLKALILFFIESHQMCLGATATQYHHPGSKPSLQDCLKERPISHKICKENFWKYPSQP